MKPSITPADTAEHAADSVSALTRWAKHLLLTQLAKLEHGRLRLVDGG